MKQYVGLESSQVRPLKQLVAKLSLDKTMLQDALRKILSGPHNAVHWSIT
jgi:hypothetical protein